MSLLAILLHFGADWAVNGLFIKCHFCYQIMNEIYICLQMSRIRGGGGVVGGGSRDLVLMDVVRL